MIMGGIYKRGRKLWRWFVDAEGVRRFQPTGYNVGEEARARAVLEAIERRVEAERKTGVAPGELTVRAFGERWLKARPAQGVSTAQDEARRLRLHVWPVVGNVLLKDLRPHHVRDMVRELKVKTLRTKTGRERTMAPRTVRHCYSTLRTMLHDAEVEELIASNPCKLKRGELPKKVDAKPGWRDGAVFTREEAEALISDPRIPEDRRVWHALMLLGGMRPGETAALLWRAYDHTAEPLGRISVHANYDSRKAEVTSTKDERPRVVPVHPTLARVLAAWKLAGYERMFGKAPGPDDLIVPNRDGQHRNGPRALRRFHEDLGRLDLRVRRQHDCRRTFMSLTRGDGARGDLIDWVVHGPSGSMLDVYTTMPYPALCAEVSKLRLELRAGKLLELRPRAAVGSQQRDSPCDSTTKGMKKPPRLIDLGASSTEREKGFEPSTPAMARQCSTAELFPRSASHDAGESPGLTALPR
jgi:integrase